MIDYHKYYNDASEYLIRLISQTSGVSLECFLLPSTSCGKRHNYMSNYMYRINLDTACIRKEDQRQKATKRRRKLIALKKSCCFYCFVVISIYKKIPISVIESKIFISLRIFQINRFLQYYVHTNLAYKPLTPFCL